MKKWQVTISILALIGFIVWLPSSPNKELMDKIEVELQKHKHHFPNAKYAILIDYNQPIFRKRLWVVEIKTQKVLKNTHVSHAYKSGIIWASVFSNEKGSNISSKGTFKTLNSYESSFGKGIYKVGMRLKGLEKNINNHAFARNIVFHCSYGFWSSGCFMTLPWVNKEIIDLTKDGNILIVR